MTFTRAYKAFSATPRGRERMSAQFASDGTHSKNGVHFSAVSEKCRVLEREAKSGDLA